jgi:hypothetical protein
MRFFNHIVPVLALALLPAGLTAQSSQVPACKANLEGPRLTTTIEFRNGYAVEAPWRVVSNRVSSLGDGRPGRVVSARLSGIVEIDPETGRRTATPFPEAIETVFEGRTHDDVLANAAQVWCMTVLKVHGGDAAPEAAPRQRRAPTPPVVRAAAR